MCMRVGSALASDTAVCSLPQAQLQVLARAGLALAAVGTCQWELVTPQALLWDLTFTINASIVKVRPATGLGYFCLSTLFFLEFCFELCL